MGTSILNWTASDPGQGGSRDSAMGRKSSRSCELNVALLQVRDPESIFVTNLQIKPQLRGVFDREPGKPGSGVVPRRNTLSSLNG
ncbi:MAG: hypothetical protein JXA19_07160 [Anaerolineales bacterium]|nr:hypothetical protein [Anaerolineales bacterium]